MIHDLILLRKRKRVITMFTELNVAIAKLSKSLATPYIKFIKQIDRSFVPTKVKTVGGFTESDWQKIGNDLRKSIILYGKKERN